MYAQLDNWRRSATWKRFPAPGAAFAPRKVYHLTAAGRLAFEEWLVSPVAHARQMRQEFLARLYFARLAGPQTAARLIDAQIEACRGWAQTLQARLAGEKSTAGFHRTVDEYRLNQIEATLGWLEQCKATPVR